MINFSPRRTPLKEGRSFPGLPYPGSSGRRLNPRQGMVILFLLVCVPLGIFYLNGGLDSSATSSQSRLQSMLSKPGSSNSEPRVLVNGARTNPPAADGAPNGDVPAGDKQTPFKAPPAARPPPASPKKGEEPVVEEPASHHVEVPAQPKGYSPKSPTVDKAPAPSIIQWSERPRFEKALARIVNMLPGEMHMRDLLRQVEGTGKEKLREMGLRVRAYKGFFEAWEELHLDTDAEGGTYVRDDVVQYLRSHEHNTEAGIAGLTDMGIAQVIRSYESYRYFLAKFGQLLFPWTAPYFSDHMTLHAHFKRGGRGIVLTAGDDQAPYLLTTIPTFRKLGCSLPIEVMYLGDSDLSEDFRSDLEALDGVVTRDIAQMVNDEGWRLAGWAAKPFAILFSSFREVIFIDADSLFFRNPEILFEDPSYKQTGALFFKDRLIMPESKKRWLQQILPKPISRQVKQTRFWTGDSGHMQESGVVVVDKWKHFMALLLVTRMNGPDRDGNKEEGRVGIYDMVYGDKETFWIGWELVGDLSYSFHGGDAGIMGRISDYKKKPKKERPRRPPKKESHEEDGPASSEGEHKDGEGEEPEHHEGEQPAHHEGEGADPAAGPILDAAPNNALPDNYTICAPQLLHLDLDGQPLWFNGWLLDNKFADKHHKKFGHFDHYLVEPRDVRDPGAWQLEESNMCCLTTDRDKKFDFSQDDKAILEMIMKQAREVGAPGSENRS